MNNTAGGVEKSSTLLMRHLLKNNHEVFLLTWDDINNSSFFKLNKKIKWYRLNLKNLNKKQSIFESSIKAFKTRKIIKTIKPDLVICFQIGTFKAFYYYSFLMNLKIFITERNSLSMYKHIKNGNIKKIKALKDFTKAQKIILQFEEYRKYFSKDCQKKIEIVNNPIFKQKIFAKPVTSGHNERYSILSVCRLEFPKNTITLINSFKKIMSQFPDWDLKIIGNGSEINSLKKIINCSRIKILPPKSNINQYYLDANIFCTTSLFEGFPNSLGEALSFGLPAIGFKNCDGVNILIKNNFNGFLVKGKMTNTKNYSEALADLMNHKHKRKKMGLNSIIISKKYSYDGCFKKWDSLILENH